MNQKSLITFYYADWDPTCIAMHRVYNQVKSQYEGRVSFSEENLMDKKGGSMCFEMVPAFVFIVRNQEVYRHIGMLTQENLVRHINAYLLEN